MNEMQNSYLFKIKIIEGKGEVQQLGDIRRIKSIGNGLSLVHFAAWYSHRFFAFYFGARYFHTKLKFKTLLHQKLLKLLRKFTIHAWRNAVKILYHRHFRAQTAPYAAHF